MDSSYSEQIYQLCCQLLLFSINVIYYYFNLLWDFIRSPALFVWNNYFSSDDLQQDLSFHTRQTNGKWCRAIHLGCVAHPYVPRLSIRGFYHPSCFYQVQSLQTAQSHSDIYSAHCSLWSPLVICEHFNSICISTREPLALRITYLLRWSLPGVSM